MLDQIRDLYQEVVFDHNRNPRNFRVMTDANRTIQGFNPLCGDRITLYAKVKDGLSARLTHTVLVPSVVIRGGI